MGEEMVGARDKFELDVRASDRSELGKLIGRGEWVAVAGKQQRGQRPACKFRIGVGTVLGL